MNPLPPNSLIKIDRQNGVERITLPSEMKWSENILLMLFLVFWLYIWSEGWWEALQEIKSGDYYNSTMLWFVLWSLGGLLVLGLLYFAIRKPAPEQLILHKTNLILALPSKHPFSSEQKYQSIKEFFQSKQYEFSTNEIKSLRLSGIDSAKSLTLTKGTENINFATTLSEIEREWLFSYLKQAYDLN